MKIAYITAGAAGMYCGSCIHDNTLAAALIAKGHDVALMPTYTPTRTDEEDVSMDRVFYGAVNVYLEQKSAIFRHIPQALHRWLDAPRLLDWVSGRGVSIDATKLGDMTLSVAMGEEGNQRRELDELVAWLRDEFRPDIVHITNSMFLGLAGPLKRELGVPVLCSLQGEDIFLDDLAEPFKGRVHRQLQEHARDVDGLVAPCGYYADFMADYLAVRRDKVHVVPLGIKLDGHRLAPARRRAGAPFVVGYLARICPEKGLHDLVEAVALLADRHGKDAVRLRAAGYLGKRDEAYLEGVRARVTALGLDEVFDYAGEVSRNEKIALLQSIDVLSVPTTYKDPKGLFVLESLSNGVPVVQPAHGSFPEMIEATGGGRLSRPGSTESLADELEALLLDADACYELGRRGAETVAQRFSEETMADTTLAVYAHFLESPIQEAAAG